MKETAQYAYEAYGNEVGWVDFGLEMPEWKDLSLRLKDAWRKAAHTAIQKGWHNDSARAEANGAQHVVYEHDARRAGQVQSGRGQ